MGTVFVAVAVSGVLAWQRLTGSAGGSSSPGFFQGTVKAPDNEAVLNGGVLSNAVKVQALLENYRQERGSIPSDAQAFNREILPLMEGGRLPVSPWGGQQPAMLGVTPDLHQAVTASGDERWIVGAGRVAKVITQPTDFGALAYEAKGAEYRIYGIGRGADGRAVVLVRLTSP